MQGKKFIVGLEEGGLSDLNTVGGKYALFRSNVFQLGGCVFPTSADTLRRYAAKISGVAYLCRL